MRKGEHHTEETKKKISKGNYAGGKNIKPLIAIDKFIKRELDELKENTYDTYNDIIKILLSFYKNKKGGKQWISKQ